MIDWTLLSVLFMFLVGMLAVGAWASRKQRTASDFYVGGRNFSTLTVTATQIASAFGGGMMVAHVGLGYQFGFSEFMYVGVAIPVGVILLATLVAEWLRKQDFYTTADWMCNQYGESKSLRVISSFVAMLVTMGWWVSQPIAAGKVMNALTGIPVNLGIIIASIVVVIYTMSGGIIAVAYTDVAQLGLMLFGMLVLLPIAIVKGGGLSTIFAAVPPENLTIIGGAGVKIVLGWLLAVLPGQMVLQIYHQRIYAAKSTKVAKQGLYNLAISCVLAGLWASILGMAIYKLNPGLQKEMAMTWAIMNLLPKAVGVIILGAIVAAIISTADSALHSTSASITRDIYQVIYNPNASDEEILSFSKKCIIVIGIIGVIIGMFIPMVLKVLVLGYTLTSSGLLFPLFLGHFWKRMTKEGAIAGMLGGVGAALAFSLVPSLKAIMPAIGAGLITSFVCMVLVSFMTKPTRVKKSVAE